jgi:hypothetical protein
LVEDLRIGSADGLAPEQFGRITAVMEDGRGRIFVLDGMAQEIRVFRSDGSFSHTIGRSGEGPGEFKAATGITLGRGDSLWVIDPVGGRYTVFDNAGRLVTSWNRPFQSFLDYWQGNLQPDGSLLDWGLRFPEEEGGIAGRRIVLQPWRFLPQGPSADSLPPLEFEQNVATIGGYPRPVPFYNVGLAVAGDPTGDIWFGRTDGYSIYRRTPAGDTILEISLPAKPSRLSDSDREHVRDRMASRPDLVPEYLRALPAYRPVLNRLIADPSGRLYVVADIEGQAPGSFLDVFRHDGLYLGRLELPKPFRLIPPRDLVVYAAEEHLLVAQMDSLGVPYVSRLRVVRP